VGPAEDEGWLIVGVHDAEAQRGRIAILDARR
jgi:carotenoid cleavage dioxygenase-like enzyme